MNTAKTDTQRFSSAWEMKRLGEIASIRNQKVLPTNVNPNTPCVELEHIGSGNGQLLKDSTAEYSTASKYCFFTGDVLFGRLRSYLRKFWLADRDGICTTEIWPLMVDTEQIDSEFLYAIVQSDQFFAMANLSYGTHMPRTDWEVMRNFTVMLPPIEEQRAIAEVLSDVDGLINALDALIAKKRAIKQATMQQLLTGKTRLPGFSGDWETKQIGDVVSPCREKNYLGANIPVLTCSKHLGFVDSLSYFKNQVFSKDLSNYKIIRRGQIGYPANHVEEGSIGLQDLYDVALVSPIYVVFSPKEDIDSFFLHRLLKLESYRQQFANATTSSINRRGSLRWPAFSKLHVTLPPFDEQVAVAAVLNDVETEIVALEKRRDKTRTIKQGMMQQLLTGKVRLLKQTIPSDR